MSTTAPNREQLIGALTNGASIWCTPQRYEVFASYASSGDAGMITIVLQPEDGSETLRVQANRDQRDTYFPDGRQYRVVLIEEGVL